MSCPDIQKLPHSLHGLDGPEAFLAALATAGVNLDEVLATCIKPSSETGILLGGSLSEGVGNASSDVDLVVLLESESELRPDCDGLIIRAGRSVELLLYRKGIEINLEVYVRKDVEELMSAFLSFAPALYNPSDVEQIPILQPFDIRFLHRLRTGWPLKGLRRIEMWRDEFMVDLLGTYLAVFHYNGFCDLFEDAVAMARDLPEAGVFVGRRGAEQAMLSLLAKSGFTSPNTKWLLHWSALARRQYPATLLDAGRSLLLDAVDDDEVQNFLHRLFEFGQNVLGVLRQDPELRRATDFLRTQIAYVAYEPEAMASNMPIRSLGA
ncbi:MAG: hypothetical protein KGO02_18925 [Alphaproteobacteria bacterium]|nr:hypothetical protein [Alphaproteobacteria bacterium]